MRKSIIFGEKSRSCLQRLNNFTQRYSQDNDINHIVLEMKNRLRFEVWRRLIKQKIIKHINCGHGKWVKSTYQQRLLLQLLNI